MVATKNVHSHAADQTNLNRSLILSAILLVALAIIGFTSLIIGVTRIPPQNLTQILIDDVGVDRVQSIVVWQVRMPRFILALVGGACLAMSGALLQDTLRNPLAEPGLLGVSSGASFAVASIIVFDFSIEPKTLPFFALLGGLAAGSVILLATRLTHDPTKMILIGAAMTAFFTACITVVVVLGSASEARSFFAWVSGSLIGRGWDDVRMIIPWAITLIPVGMLLSRPLNLLRLGDDVAEGLGLPVYRTRSIIVLCSIGLVAPVVAAMGPIGFVALIGPHLARAILGTGNALSVLPVSAFLGATLLSLSDLAAREILSPAELPVGLILAGAGAPVAIVFIRKMGAQKG